MPEQEPKPRRAAEPEPAAEPAEPVAPPETPRGPKPMTGAGRLWRALAHPGRGQVIAAVILFATATAALL